MTDLEKARMIVTPLSSLMDQYTEENAVFPLDEICAKNQNPPEHGGGADGSFNVTQWEALRDIIINLRRLSTYLKLLGKLTDGSNHNADV